MNEFEKVKIKKQILSFFFIGKYHDEVLYDVIPMYAGHLLLGHLWQFYISVVHDRFRNRNSFVNNEKFITLVPLSPK